MGGGGLADVKELQELCVQQMIHPMTGSRILSLTLYVTSTLPHRMGKGAVGHSDTRAPWTGGRT